MRDDCIDHGRGHVTKEGYSTVRTQEARDIGTCMLHRVVFHRAQGYLPPVVMHTCDNPRCINPDHLVAGDWGSNNKDRAVKGRSAQRVDSKRKVTDEQAALVRSRYTPGRTAGPNPNGAVALAKELGVDSTVIYNIIKRKTHFAS